MQRPPQRGHAAGHAGVGIGATRSGQAHGGGRGVLLVVGVQDENAIERTRQHRIGFVGFARGREHHVHEILGVGQAVLRVHEGLAFVVFVTPRRHRRHLRDQPVRHDLALMRIEDVHVFVIKRRHRTGDADHHRHRMRVAAETAKHVFHLVVQHGVVADRLHECHFLLSRRQFAVQQQITHFHVVGLVRQFLDGIAAVIQQPFVAVDVGDRRIAAGGRGEAGIVGEVALRSQRADVDHRLAVGALLDRQFDGRTAVAESECGGFFHCNSIILQPEMFAGIEQSQQGRHRPRASCLAAGLQSPCPTASAAAPARLSR